MHTCLAAMYGFLAYHTMGLIKYSLKLYLQSYFVAGKAFKHFRFAVLFTFTGIKQACLKSCYSEDSQRENILSLYDPKHLADKQQQPCNFK